MAASRTYSILENRPFNTSGTYTLTLTANILSFDKTAADDTTVVVFPIPKLPRTATQDDPAVSVIECSYSVATAALDAAPTAVLNLCSKSATTKVTSRAATTQAITFAGTNTVGTAAGTYDAIVTITTPARLTDLQYYELELTFNAAATTVLKLFGISITHTGA